MPHLDPVVGCNIDGRFRVVSRLGSGSMGAVYRAEQHPVGRDVAVKILRRERSFDAAAKARFLREARVHSQLSSPNTVQLLDFGQSASGELFLTMELLEGESLGQRLSRVTRFAPRTAVDVARQILRALAEAHQKGIVHRDLKPDNVFHARVGSGEMVKVLDFGIAKMLGEGHGLVGNGKVFETQQGTVFGTPRYMSPEQAQGKPLDGRSDLYAVGVLLYQMLTGAAPFNDAEPVVVMSRHIRTAPKPLLEVCRDARIPPALANAVHRALAKSPGSRPQTAEEMSLELATAMQRPKARAWYDGKTIVIPTIKGGSSYARYAAFAAAGLLGLAALGASAKGARGGADASADPVALAAAAPLPRSAPGAIAPADDPAPREADPSAPTVVVVPATPQAAGLAAVAPVDPAPTPVDALPASPIAHLVPTVDVNSLPRADSKQHHGKHAPPAAPPRVASPRGADKPSAEKYGAME